MRQFLWKNFGNTCSAATGPPLASRVTSCTAKDGRNWGSKPSN